VLLKRGFDVNLRDKLDKATALYWAAHSGNTAVIQRLLQDGAEIELEGDAHHIGVLGWTVYLKANTEAAKFLLSCGAEANIFTAVMLDRADLVQRIVDQDRSQLGRRMSEFDHSRTEPPEKQYWGGILAEFRDPDGNVVTLVGRD